MWWQKKAARKQLSATLKYILAAARERRWKLGRHGEGRGGREVVEWESDEGGDGPRYAGTDTGDTQMGKLS